MSWQTLSSDTILIVVNSLYHQGVKRWEVRKHFPIVMSRNVHFICKDEWRKCVLSPVTFPQTHSKDTFSDIKIFAFLLAPIKIVVSSQSHVTFSVTIPVEIWRFLPDRPSRDLLSNCCSWRTCVLTQSRVCCNLQVYFCTRREIWNSPRRSGRSGC